MAKSINGTLQDKSNENNEQSSYPILYSLRNCPYAMRGRLAIFKAKHSVLLRDLVLTNKPPELLVASPKGTVPVVVLPNGNVIEESLEIMLWALQQSDPDDLLHARLSNNLDHILTEMLMLINDFDENFKRCLEAYKCAKRYQEDNIVECRETCLIYIEQLEQRLTKHDFLMSDRESLADIALVPFIRQFARVERQWYLQSPYPQVRQWLNRYLQSATFTKVMAKHPLWLEHQQEVFFP